MIDVGLSHSARQLTLCRMASSSISIQAAGLGRSGRNAGRLVENIEREAAIRRFGDRDRTTVGPDTKMRVCQMQEGKWHSLQMNRELGETV